MPTVFRVAIVLLALFFAIGGFFAWRGSLDANTYIIVTGIVGSIASLVGLVALASPRLTVRDVRAVESDLLRDLSTTMQSVKEYEAQASAGRQDIGRLAQERAEIELLVRQASLRAFMEERLHHIALELNKRFDGDQALKEMLDEYTATLDQVKEIDGKIERSERADLIQSVLRDVRPKISRQPYPSIVIRFMGNRIDVGPVIYKVGTAYMQLLRKSLRG